MILSTENSLFAQSEFIPCAINQPVISYHSIQKAIFLFGGFCNAEKIRINDLWKFDGKKWIKVPSKISPEPRSGHSMIYDSFNNRLIVFGGKNNNSELLNDLWAWDSEGWKLLSKIGPLARQSHRIAMNSSTGEIVLFGGSNANKESLNDTWVYSNKKWTKVSTDQSPPGRLQHTMVYDQQRNKLVLFGGFDRTENSKIIYGDTWEWTLSEGWKLKNDTEQMSRDHHAMAYDMNLKRIILFGGYNKGYLGDTWSWNGNDWNFLTKAGPSARGGKPGLLFNLQEEFLILFGGWDKGNKPLQDFWKFKSGLWTSLN